MKKRYLIFLLTLLLCTLTLSAHAADTLGIRVIKTQLTWDETIRASWEELSPAEQYAGLEMVGMLGEIQLRGQAGWLDAVDSVSSVADVQALIGNGVVSLYQPGAHDPDILPRAVSYLTALGYTEPEGHLIVCIDDWTATFGHVEVTETDGVMTCRSIQEYELVIDSTTGALRSFRIVPPPEDDWF